MDANPPPQAWLDALEKGEADLAAGRVGPWPPLRDAMEAVLAAVERGADDAERERLLHVLDAIAEGTHEDAPTRPRIGDCAWPRGAPRPYPALAQPGWRG